jgi:hypothetical protein
MAERAIINIDVLTDEDDVEELREELEDAEDQAGETAESVGDVGSEAVESERSVRSLGRSLRRLDGTDVNVDVDTGSTGGMGRRGRRRLPGELDEVQRSLEIIGSLRPELLATVGAVTTLTGSLVAAGGLSAAALVAANETGVLTEEIKNLKGEGKATARSFAQEFKPVLEGDVIPALSRLLTIIEGASDELATFTGSVFDLLRKLKGTPGPVGLLSTIFVPSEEEGTPGPADRIENVIRKVERKLENARDRFATMRVFDIGEKKIIEDRISTLEELRKKLIKTRASVDLKDAPEKWRTLDALIRNVQQRLEEARQASESFDQRQQPSLLERQQEKVSELRKQVKMLSRVEGQRLTRTRQTKEELKRKVELQKQLNRLQQEALPEGFETDSPGANIFARQQSEEFARNLQAGARAIDRMAGRQQTMNQLLPDPGSVQAANLSLRQMLQTMQQVVRQFGVGALNVDKFIEKVSQVGDRLQKFDIADTRLQAIRSQIRAVKQALKILREEGVDPASQEVQKLKDKLESLQQAAVGLRIAQQAGLQLATSGFKQLGRAIAGADDAMEKFGQTFASTLQTVGQALLQSAIAGPLGLGFGALGGVFTLVGGAVSGALGLAEGGLVRGPGTSTSDSIPAVLSDREFVVNAGSAQMAPSALKAINEDPTFASMIEQFVAKPPEQFATDGFVTTPVAGSAIAGGRTLIGEGDREMPALPQGSRAASGAETQQTLDQAKPIRGEIEIQLETEVKRINKRKLALLVRTENERRKQFQI